MEYRAFIGHLSTKLERAKPKVRMSERGLHYKLEAHMKGNQRKGGDLIIYVSEYF